MTRLVTPASHQKKSNNFEPIFSDSTLTFLTSENIFRHPILPTRRAVLLCLPLVLIRGRQSKIMRRVGKIGRQKMFREVKNVNVKSLKIGSKLLDFWSAEPTPNPSLKGRAFQKPTPNPSLKGRAFQTST